MQRDKMTVREINNLIEWLRKQKTPADKIFDCLKYIEKGEKENDRQSGNS